MRVLIAGVGNVLRGDDGFGVEVARTLIESAYESEDINIFEAGIAGISLVQELMSGYDMVIVADAVDRGAAPGTLFVIEPDVADPGALDPVRLHQSLVDAHYTEPSRVLLLARALGVLPPKAFILGCQPAACDELGVEMTPEVRAAVRIAAHRIKSLIEESGRQSAEA